MHSIFTIITLISIATLTNVQLHFNIKLVGVFNLLYKHVFEWTASSNK